MKVHMILRFDVDCGRTVEYGIMMIVRLMYSGLLVRGNTLSTKDKHVIECNCSMIVLFVSCLCCDAQVMNRFIDTMRCDLGITGS